MKLDKSDNDIIIKHIYQWNKGAATIDKMAFDVYIESLDFLEDGDIIFNCVRIKPILDPSCGIDENSTMNSLKNIGDNVVAKLSDFESPYKEILKGAIRDIKLTRVIR